MLDEPDVIRRKIARAVTDSDAEVRYDVDAKPGVSNLLELLASATETTPDQAGSEHTTYGSLKSATADAIIELLRPVQERYADLVAHPDAVDWALKTGRDHAAETASRRLDAAYDAIGLV